MYQALACCDAFLSELSVALESADDTSGAAQVSFTCLSRFSCRNLEKF